MNEQDPNKQPVPELSYPRRRWVIPRSELEAMSDERLRFETIDLIEKVGLLYNAVRLLGPGDLNIERALHPERIPPESEDRL